MAGGIRSLLPRSIDTSLILGGVLTAAFYGVMFQPAFQGTILARYTTKNPVDYAITFLFLWSIADIALKCLAFPRELVALRQSWLPERTGQEPVENARTILDQIAALPPWRVASRIGQRIQKVLGYALEHGTGQDYRDQIKYLSEKAEEDSHGRYSVVRFAIAITPMLGFLGTVVHFGTALSGISFEEMDSRLADVVSHMGEAFNTTTSALAVAMTVMFVLFLVERMDKGINATVDRFVERELETRFLATRRAASPELAGLQTTHDEALGLMASTLERQVAQWSGALERLFERIETRREADNAAWQEALAMLERRHEALEAREETRLEENLIRFGERQETHLESLHGTLAGIVELRNDFQAVGATLEQIASGEGRLSDLQGKLVENLQILQTAQKMDDALHGMTAAIHLMTARYQRGGEGSPAARAA